jgi:hypothetical protein
MFIDAVPYFVGCFSGAGCKDEIVYLAFEEDSLAIDVATL